MRYFILMAVWFLVLVLDAVILPPLINIPGGFGTIIFLLVLALSFGVHHWLVIGGIIVAAVSEILFGFYFGSLIAPWLIVVAIWHAAYHFLSLTPFAESRSWISLIPLSIIGFLLLVLFEISEWAIIKLVYSSGTSFLTVSQMMISPKLFVAVSLELVILLMVVRIIFFKKSAAFSNEQRILGQN